MAEYNLNDTSQPIAVAFAPLAVPMVAHFVHWDDTNFWSEGKPVLGALVRHVVNAYGEVTEDRVDMAIQCEDAAELCTPMDHVLSCGRCSLVAVLPEGETPSAEEIQRVATLGYQLEKQLAERKAVS